MSSTTSSLLLSMATAMAITATAPNSPPSSPSSPDEDDVAGHMSRLKRLAQELSNTAEQIQQSIDWLLNKGIRLSVSAVLEDFNAGTNVLDGVTRFFNATKFVIFSSRAHNARERDSIDVVDDEEEL